MAEATSDRPRKVWYDEEKVDEMALALLWLTAHREHRDELCRAWKGMDWEVIDRLEARGLLINSPKAKSVAFTKEGEARCKELFQKHFGTSRAADIPPLPADDEEGA